MSTEMTKAEEPEARPARLGVGDLPPQIQQALTLRKMQNAVAAELAKLSWGKSLDLDTRRAIAEYGRKFRLDPTTELDVLGGRLYPNAKYYIRRLAEKVDSGEIDYAVADHLHVDERLAEMARAKAPDDATKAEVVIYAEQREAAIRELGRRALERIKYNAPSNATAIVAFRVKHRKLEQEVVGVKWCGGGTRKNDPVGDQFPVETSESRAARRAMRQLVSHFPKAEQEEFEAMEMEGEAIEVKIAADEAKILPPRGISPLGSEDEYTDTDAQHATRRAIATAHGGGDDETGAESEEEL